MSTDRFKRNGIFKSSGFKCPECRKKFRPGTHFVAYHAQGDLFDDQAVDWWSCVPCAGMYAELAVKSGEA